MCPHCLLAKFSEALGRRAQLSRQRARPVRPCEAPQDLRDTEAFRRPAEQRARKRHESAGRAVALACDRRGDPALAEFMARLDNAAPACTCSSCHRGRPRRTTPPKGSRGAGRPAQDQGRTALAGRRGGVLRDAAAQDGQGDARPADARLSKGCTDPRRAAPRRVAPIPPLPPGPKTRDRLRGRGQNRGGPGAHACPAADVSVPPPAAAGGGEGASARGRACADPAPATERVIWHAGNPAAWTSIAGHPRAGAARAGDPHGEAAEMRRRQCRVRPDTMRAFREARSGRSGRRRGPGRRSGRCAPRIARPPRRRRSGCMPGSSWTAIRPARTCGMP